MRLCEMCNKNELPETSGSRGMKQKYCFACRKIRAAQAIERFNKRKNGVEE